MVIDSNALLLTKSVAKFILEMSEVNGKIKESAKREVIENPYFPGGFIAFKKEPTAERWALSL